MKRRSFLVAGGVLGAPVLVTVLGALGINYSRVGRTLDAYKGVEVHDNGFLFAQSHGRNYAADGYYYGQKWQCTEFIKRFLHDAKHHIMPDVWGHAKEFFDPDLQQGGLNVRRGLLQFRNGDSERPRPDDLLVFTDTTYGHVCIVAAVDQTKVEVVQQNIFGRPRQTFELQEQGGRYSIVSPRVPAGWLRVPAGEPHEPGTLRNPLI